MSTYNNTPVIWSISVPEGLFQMLVLLTNVASCVEMFGIRQDVNIIRMFDLKTRYCSCVCECLHPAQSCGLPVGSAGGLVLRVSESEIQQRVGPWVAEVSFSD